MMSIALRHPTLTLSYVASRRTTRSVSFLRHVRLQPANHTMDPIYVKDVVIQGVVRAVIRKFQPV